MSRSTNTSLALTSNSALPPHPASKAVGVFPIFIPYIKVYGLKTDCSRFTLLFELCSTAIDLSCSTYMLWSQSLICHGNLLTVYWYETVMSRAGSYLLKIINLFSLNYVENGNMTIISGCLQFMKHKTFIEDKLNSQLNALKSNNCVSVIVFSKWYLHNGNWKMYWKYSKYKLGK